MFVETKLKNIIPLTSQWKSIQKPGNIFNENIRGGSMVQTRAEINLGKANPPKINNIKNECLHFTLPYQNEKLHVLLLYIHPNEIIDSTVFIKAALYKYCLIIGDFNPNTHKNKQLQHFLKNSNFVKIDTPPTFIMTNNASTTPDLILCTDNIKNNIKKINIIPDLCSDHQSIEITFNLQTKINTSPEMIYDFNKCNLENLNVELTDYIKSMQNLDPTIITQFLNFTCQKILDNSPKKPKTFYNQVLPPFILRLLRTKRQMLREIHKYDNQNLKSKFNDLNKDIKILILQYKSTKYLEACKNISNLKGKNYWQEIKKLSGYKKNTHKNVEIVENNVVLNEDQDVADAFGRHYKKIYEMSEDINFDDQSFKEINDWYELYFNDHTDPGEVPEVTEEEYYHVLNTGKNTAPGYDHISKKTLKNLCAEFHGKVLDIYNYCNKNRYYPQEFKKGIIINIPKPNCDLTKTTNFRPITLLPVIGKNLEKIIKIRLEEELDDKIPPHQFGFRKNSSTIHPLLILTSNVQTNNLKGNKSAALFMDISKAFDSVWHAGLLYKLYSLNCPKYLIHFINNFLKNRLSLVKHNQKLSKSFSMQQGVPQGSPLSPILYNLFTYDIYSQQFNPNTYILEFADDKALIAHQKNLKLTLIHLQNLCNNIIQFFSKWRIKPNPNKTQLIIFNHKININSPSIKIFNQQIRPSNSCKYLGIHLDSKLNFNLHAKLMKTKMITRAKHFRSLTYKNNGIQPETAIKIYKMICRPIIEYAFLIYLNCKKTTVGKLEVAERSSLRIITKMRHPDNPLHNPSNQLLYETTQVTPILERFKELACQFAKKHHNIQIMENLMHGRDHNLPPKRKYPTQTLWEIITDITNED